MSTKFSTILQACASEMAEDHWLVVGTSTQEGSTSTIVDTALNDTRSDADLTYLNGHWIRTTFDVAATATEHIRQVTSFAANTPAGSGTITVMPVMGDKHPDATEYEVYYVTHPQRVKDGVNDALADMSYQEILPLTLVVNGDMDVTDPTTNWKENAIDTVAYDTTKVQFGGNSLKVTDDGSGGGYASMAAGYLPVTPGEQLIVWAPVYGDQQGAQLTLYDQTAGADIETARHDEEGWGLLCFTATVPEDCLEVDVHLETITISGTTYWDHVGLLKTAQLFYDRPLWLARSQDFMRIIGFPKGNSLTSDDADNAYRMWTRPPQQVSTLGLIEAHDGVVPLRLQLGSHPTIPTFVKGKRFYPALTADADTTMADKKAAIAGGLYHTYRQLGPDYADRAAEWGYRFMRLRRGVEARQTVRMVSPYA